jgi:hypothetical protein
VTTRTIDTRNPAWLILTLGLTLLARPLLGEFLRIDQSLTALDRLLRPVAGRQDEAHAGC